MWCLSSTIFSYVLQVQLYLLLRQFQKLHLGSFNAITWSGIVFVPMRLLVGIYCIGGLFSRTWCLLVLLGSFLRLEFLILDLGLMICFDTYVLLWGLSYCGNWLPKNWAWVMNFFLFVWMYPFHNFVLPSSQITFLLLTNKTSEIKLPFWKL